MDRNNNTIDKGMGKIVTESVKHKARVVKCCEKPRYILLPEIPFPSTLWGCASCGEYRKTEPPEEWKAF